MQLDDEKYIQNIMAVVSPYGSRSAIERPAPFKAYTSG